MSIERQSIAAERTARRPIKSLGITLGRGRPLNRAFYGLLFVLPSVAFLLLFNIYPMISGLYYSLTRFTLLKPPVFIGLDNFTKLVGDARFINAIKVTTAFILGTTFPKWALSLALALLFRGRFRFKETYKVLYFTPALLSGVVISLVWKLLYHPSGLLNVIIGPIVNKAEIFWLGSRHLAPFAIMIVNNWSGIGYLMLIWLAGLVGIPREFYEAASIDGANKWHSFWNITLPLLKPTLVFILVTSMIGAFQSFNLQFVMTAGGPNDATTTVALLIYQHGFQYFKMGEAAAMAIFMFVVIISITIIQMRLLKAEEVSYT